MALWGCGGPTELRGQLEIQSFARPPLAGSAWRHSHRVRAAGEPHHVVRPASDHSLYELDERHVEQLHLDDPSGSLTAGLLRNLPRPTQNCLTNDAYTRHEIGRVYNNLRPSWWVWSGPAVATHRVATAATVRVAGSLG